LLIKLILTTIELPPAVPLEDKNIFMITTTILLIVSYWILLGVGIATIMIVLYGVAVLLGKIF
jgi:hypothetical protein